MVSILIILGVFFGALPDLIGAYGNLVEHDHWALYRRSHFGDIEETLQYVPMYWLHLQLDRLMHGPSHRWWKVDERLWLEFILWVINVVVIVWLLNVWRNQTNRARTLETDSARDSI